jgi:hypothetical protein
MVATELTVVVRGVRCRKIAALACHKTELLYTPQLNSTAY